MIKYQDPARIRLLIQKVMEYGTVIREWEIEEATYFVWDNVKFDRLTSKDEVVKATWGAIKIDALTQVDLAEALVHDMLTRLPAAEIVSHSQASRSYRPLPHVVRWIATRTGVPMGSGVGDSYLEAVLNAWIDFEERVRRIEPK